MPRDGAVGSAKLLAGKYHLVEPIGYGGMAVVWRAETRGAAGFARPVAIKKMKTDLRGGADYVAMFIEEARVGAELQHPNIVQVFDFCQDTDGLYCLVMEWVDGIDMRAFMLSARERKQALPWELVSAIGVGTLRGLAAAHERTHADGTPAPVIHRDISPANILLRKDGVVKLADFGLARARDRMHSLTGPGIIKGKLAYIAPEITRGTPSSMQSDLFGVGCVLWEAIAGHALYDGVSDIEVFRKAQVGAVRPLAKERAGLPAPLVEIIHRALAPNPDHRFRSARDMAHALAAVVAGARAPIDAQTQLAHAVREARAHTGAPQQRDDESSEIVALSKSDYEIE